MKADNHNYTKQKDANNPQQAHVTHMNSVLYGSSREREKIMKSSEREKKARAPPHVYLWLTNYLS